MAAMIKKSWWRCMMRSMWKLLSVEDTQREHLSNLILEMLSPVLPDRFVSFQRRTCLSLFSFICWDPSGNEVNGYPRSVSPEKVLRAALTRTRGHLTTSYSSEFWLVHSTVFSLLWLVLFSQNSLNWKPLYVSSSVIIDPNFCQNN